MTTRNAVLSAFAILLVFSLCAPAQTFSITAGSASAGAGTLPDTLFTPVFPAATAATGVGGDVDAVSMGRPYTDVDYLLGYQFSVDPLSIGSPGSAVFAESGGAVSGDQSADIYYANPFASPGVNAQLWDGNGLPPGPSALGLVEPFSTPGDDLDAWDMRTVGFAATVFFSIDVTYASGLPPGFSSADVYASAATPAYDGLGFFGTYAAAGAIGLDLGGASSDEMDALVVYDNGDGVFGGGATVDTILFSLAPGSAAFVTPGSPYFGLLPGDILFANSLGAAGLHMSGSMLGLLPTDNLNALDTEVVPEPASLALLGLGLVVLVSRSIRRRVV
ncbi:MAG: PEP-CTERM sorting domain-containing protein [Verrucomicrobia bacterium]|nr:PEP-CTERM sorting domain-containing protein [Verrucomicrobiota bacterium]